MDSYLTVNQAHWDERAPAHAASSDYGFDRFASDPSHLSSVVKFDLPRLGSVDGLRGVHLQCHIGTDTLSLARLGASMTGAIPGHMTQDPATEEWRLTENPSRLACTYTLQAAKTS